MRIFKSNFGTTQIDSHGTGPRPGGHIEDAGTGLPTIDQHGTGRPGFPRTPRAILNVALVLLLSLGFATTAAAEAQHFQEGGLTLRVDEDRVTVSWLRDDGQLVVAHGRRDGDFLSVPATLLAVDLQGKVQQSGSGDPGGGKVQQSGSGDPGGGKVQQSGSGDPGGGKLGLAGYLAGRAEVLFENGVAGTLTLAFEDRKETLAFSFNRKGQFARVLRR